MKEKSIDEGIRDFILDGIKPYKGGNDTLWALHDLNITDKHKLLIPVLQLMKFDGIMLQHHEKTIPLDYFVLMDESGSAPIPSTLFLADQLTVKDKGHGSAAILFGMGTPFKEDKAVIPLIPPRAIVRFTRA